MRLSLQTINLPRYDSLKKLFRATAEAGFDGLEVKVPRKKDETDRIGDAAKEAGLAIHTVVVANNEAFYLSDANPTDAIRETLNALQWAKTWGAESVLLIPGCITGTDSYELCRTRSRQIIQREILPVARELNIILGIENVEETSFLSSAPDYVAFIDSFDSPNVKAILDLGNVTDCQPQHWIRTAGARVTQMHVKDISSVRRWAGRTMISKQRVGEGSVDWAATKAAMRETGFSGWLTCAWPHPYWLRGVHKGLGLLARGRIEGPASAVLAPLRILTKRSLQDGSKRVRDRLIG